MNKPCTEKREKPILVNPCLWIYWELPSGAHSFCCFLASTVLAQHCQDWSPAETEAQSHSCHPSSGKGVNVTGMLWHRSQAIVRLFCFLLDFLWLSKGEKTFKITTNKCKTILKCPKNILFREQPVDFLWPRNGSCPRWCFPDILSPIYYCTFSKLSCSSFHCLLSYLSIFWEHCIVIIRLMLIHSLPSFLSYLAWLHYRPRRKVFVVLKKFFLAIIFSTFRFLVLMDRKCPFFVTCHIWSSGSKKKWASL